MRYSMSAARVMAVVAGAAFAASAFGQVDPAAKAVLEESAAAIKAMPAVTYNGKRAFEGTNQFDMKTDGRVVFIRNAVQPSGSTMEIEGNLQFPTQAARPVHVVYAEGKAQWVSQSEKMVYEKRGPAADVAAEVKRVRDQLVPDAFFELSPMEKDLRGQVVSMEEARDFDGVKCQVVKIWNNDNQRGRRYYIAMTDRLPRKIEQLSGLKGAPNGIASFTLEMNNFKVVPELKGESVKLATPEGYQRRDAGDAGAPVKATKPGGDAPLPNPNASEPTPSVPPTGVPPTGVTPQAPTQPTGGLPHGTQAPAFSLKDSGGKDVSLSENSGRTVVLGFWGPLFGGSQGAMTNLNELSKSLASKGVSVYGVAVRDRSGSAAKKFGEWNLNIPLLVGGDEVAQKYAVRGYPSFVVINPEGKVSAYLEATSGPEQLQKAVEQAMGGK